MPSNPSPGPSTAHHRPEPVDDTMHQFMDVLADDPYEQPTLAGFPPQAPDERTVAMIELGGVDPHDALLGLELGEVFDAVAFCGAGRAWTLPDAADDPAASPAPVRLVHGVRADGTWEAMLWHPDGGSRRRWGTADDGPIGHIDDLLRRTLGLPTAAPTVSPLHFWAGLWLSIVGSTLRHRALEEAPARRDIAGLHPAMLPPGDPRVFDAGFDRRALGGEDLVEAGRAFAEVHDWTHLRTGPAVAETGASWGYHGDWLDDGAFSRLALSGSCSLRRRLDAIGATAERRWGAAYGRNLCGELEAVLDAWGLDPELDPNVPWRAPGGGVRTRHDGT